MTSFLTKPPDFSMLKKTIIEIFGNEIKTV